MKGVADSHALLFYLFIPDQLSASALEALGEAEDSDGIVVSAATLGDLWYASHKAGERGLAPGTFDSLQSTILDPETRFEIAALDAATMSCLASSPSPDCLMCPGLAGVGDDSPALQEPVPSSRGPASPPLRQARRTNRADTACRFLHPAARIIEVGCTAPAYRELEDERYRDTPRYRGCQIPKSGGTDS